MRKHIVAKDIRAKDISQAGFFLPNLSIRTRLVIRKNAHWRNLECRPGGRFHGVRQDRPNSPWPVERRPPAYTRIEHDRVELVECFVKSAG